MINNLRIHFSNYATGRDQSWLRSVLVRKWLAHACSGMGVEINPTYPFGGQCVCDNMYEGVECQSPLTQQLHFLEFFRQMCSHMEEMMRAKCYPLQHRL